MYLNKIYFYYRLFRSRLVLLMMIKIKKLVTVDLGRLIKTEIKMK